MARSLVLVSFSLRKILTLPKYATVTRLCHSSLAVKESDTTNDVSIIKQSPHNSESDMNGISIVKQLYIKLQTDNNPLNLISIIERNKDAIHAGHIVVALTSMQKFYQNSGLQLSEIRNSLEFVKMCSILRRNLNKLDLLQVVQVLKVLNLLQVPSTTTIMQSLLQLIRFSINDLTLQKITYLSYLLKKMNQTPLTNAILKALPEVFVAQIELQLDKTNIKELKAILEYASLNIHDEKSIEYIIDALNQNNEQIEVNTAMNIYLSICNFNKLSHKCHILKNRVEKILIDYIALLGAMEVYKILNIALIKSLQEKTQFYNPELIDTFIKQFVSTKPNFDKGIYILNKLNKLKHVNIALLDYISSVCLEQPMILSECRAFNCASFVCGLALANRKPPAWEELQEIIVKRYNFIPDDVTLSYFALYLLSLDCFDSKLLEHVFTLDINPNSISFNHCKVLQQLHQTVKTLYPTYTGPWLSNTLIQSFETITLNDLAMRNQNIYSLKPIIEKILGDSAYVQANVQTSLGHIIDYLIILQDGSPVTVKLQSSSEDSCAVPSVDDFNIPPNAERVAVIEIPWHMHAKNIPIIQAPALLNIKSLEAMSFKVVPVSIPQLSITPESERLPYLKRLIDMRNKNYREVGRQ